MQNGPTVSPSNSNQEVRALLLPKCFRRAFRNLNQESQSARQVFDLTGVVWLQGPATTESHRC